MVVQGKAARLTDLQLIGIPAASTDMLPVLVWASQDPGLIGLRLALLTQLARPRTSKRNFKRGYTVSLELFFISDSVSIHYGTGSQTF